MRFVSYKNNNDSDFKKILITEDITYVLKTLKRILSDEGYFVLTAKTGEEALSKFHKYSPDLMTIDQHLPDMPGLDLAEKIRQTNSYDVKLVFISAVYDRDFIKSVLKSGINDYLIKPFQKKKLLETVKRLLDNPDVNHIE